MFLLPIFIPLFHSVYSSILTHSAYEDNPCTTCTKISENFIKHYKRTAGNSFGGGNTDWEERNLKRYAHSESRLIEIMENSCSKSESQCNSFLEKHEESIEEWYQTSSKETIDNFHQWLCIDTSKVCCSVGTFGKNCRRCQYGDNGFICSGNGNCDGDGTRTGNGRCICHAQYSGTNCSSCQTGYTRTIDDNNKVICTDIDECRQSFFLSPCLLYKCKNTEGSYECYGEPFYHELPKLGTLAVLFLTAIIFIYKEMHILASFTCLATTVVIILFVKHIL